MKTKLDVCKICAEPIIEREPVYYFPKVPEWHELSDLSGTIVHINCIKTIDSQRMIGRTLADMNQDIASGLDFTPFIARDGNVIVQGNLDSKAIEISDYENFVELSVPFKNLERLRNLPRLESVSCKMQTIRRLENDKLSIEYDLFSVELTSIDYARFKRLMDLPEIEACFDDSRLQMLINNNLKK